MQCIISQCFIDCIIKMTWSKLSNYIFSFGTYVHIKNYFPIKHYTMYMASFRYYLLFFLSWQRHTLEYQMKSLKKKNWRSLDQCLNSVACLKTLLVYFQHSYLLLLLHSYLILADRKCHILDSQLIYLFREKYVKGRFF